VLATRVGNNELQMAPEQVAELQVAPVQTRVFAQQREAIGIIDLNQDQRCRCSRPTRAASVRWPCARATT
jgi:cobalt-zinc-cadmium efflux system membrane fusion protein